MKRVASTIQLSKENYEEYKKLHSEVWPEVLQMIKECNIQNYSIYYSNGQLFSYFEYTGTDYQKDMEKMAQDSATQKWWEICKPLQTPYETRKSEEWWMEMEELFYLK
ncbi:L-rhamnose mutarotase [Metasolibacillus sp. FSL K6-0083]|uniref:L-rhamnose mutarotase n=1 Tax=Metasolibacillus sp. FSL K6-0083 TaxID=2921416 RepID=UPI003159B734